MNFGITSMKQRAQTLIRSTKPNPKAIGAIFSLVLIVYFTMIIFGMEKNNWILIIAAEVICMNFRNSNLIYGLKISREEKSGFSDTFIAFKENGMKMFALCIIKDILYIIGLFFLLVGSLIPFYCFRFSTQLIYDEKTSVLKAMQRSAALLKGHYFELIKLDFLVLFWYVITYFTYGIAGIYAKPYSAILYGEFYDYLKACEKIKEM